LFKNPVSKILLRLIWSRFRMGPLCWLSAVLNVSGRKSAEWIWNWSNH